MAMSLFGALANDELVAQAHFRHNPLVACVGTDDWEFDTIARAAIWY